jgi:hypothetical protein
MQYDTIELRPRCRAVERRNQSPAMRRFLACNHLICHGLEVISSFP